MKNLIILLIAVYLISSCKKDKPKSYTINGQITNCNNGVLSPVFTNTKIELFQQNNGSNSNSKVLATTTTDSQGNFSFTYETANTFDKLIIRTEGGFGFSRIMEDIPLENINNLKVILPAYNLVVGLDVTKNYTSLDSILVLKPDSNVLFKISGPFVSGRLFKCKNVLLQGGDLKYSENKQKLSCGFYNNNTFATDLSKIYTIENSKLCGDTVYVNIDVK